MSSARFSGCRALWPSLAALLLLLSWCGLHPARAQGSGSD